MSLFYHISVYVLECVESFSRYSAEGRWLVSFHEKKSPLFAQHLNLVRAVGVIQQHEHPSHKEFFFFEEIFSPSKIVLYYQCTRVVRNRLSLAVVNWDGISASEQKHIFNNVVGEDALLLPALLQSVNLISTKCGCQHDAHRNRRVKRGRCISSSAPCTRGKDQVALSSRPNGGERTTLPV